MRCRYINCDKHFERPYRLPNTRYCERHRCAKKDCGEFSLKTYCDEHRCAMKRCPRKVSYYDRRYCEYHTCGTVECNSAVWKDDYCSLHHCPVRGCRSGVSLNNVGYLCVSHACRVHENKGQCRRYNFMSRDGKCRDYHCTVPDCYNPLTAFIQNENRGCCADHYCQQCEKSTLGCFHDYTISQNRNWIYHCTHLGPNGHQCGKRRARVITDGVLKYDEYCRGCLKYCEIESCLEPHVRGSPRCLKHTCVCFGGHMRRRHCDHADIEFKKEHWQCQSDRCNVCRHSPQFTALYFMIALGCAAPILAALETTRPRLSGVDLIRLISFPSN